MSRRPTPGTAFIGGPYHRRLLLVPPRPWNGYGEREENGSKGEKMPGGFYRYPYRPEVHLDPKAGKGWTFMVHGSVPKGIGAILIEIGATPDPALSAELAARIAR